MGIIIGAAVGTMLIAFIEWFRNHNTATFEELIPPWAEELSIK